MTNSESLSIAFTDHAVPCFSFTRYGNRLIAAGNTVSENIQAANMPTAVILPRCQYGGESEKFSDRKPTTVVSDVIVTGRKLMRTASISASLFAMPSRTKLRSDIRM